MLIKPEKQILLTHADFQERSSYITQFDISNVTMDFYLTLSLHSKNKFQIIPYREFSHMNSFSMRNFLYGE